ncbi:GNAT family N-acetyltransferase [Leekyejoonella antrihumi]|uniref:GNAT family N-acetyltransferase n=1 Tax=Leekyejoonella antrihumi TaxID=1660198 RepID=A0A563DWH1_9MICO|nr:GNAT family N-acetyltransferase [Leekyejoonella antrihumi]TWP34555.1 GNAT family N-acetyltransferase [Leekyejoonella antrihumi]
MRIRVYRDSDQDTLIALTISTFRPFYEQSFPQLMNHDEHVITHQHGQWEEDHRWQVPSLHSPAEGKHVAVAVDDEDQITGYVAWCPDTSRPTHGEIDIIAVDAGHRGAGIGTALMEHAMSQMRADGMRFVELGTGGDTFHAPARRLYEALGFYVIPTATYLRSL